MQNNFPSLYSHSARLSASAVLTFWGSHFGPPTFQLYEIGFDLTESISKMADAHWEDIFVSDPFIAQGKGLFWGQQLALVWMGMMKSYGTSTITALYPWQFSSEVVVAWLAF